MTLKPSTSRIASIGLLLTTLAGCSQWVERFTTPLSPQPTTTRTHEYRNPARTPPPEPRTPPRTSVYSAPPLLECRSDRCKRNCHVEIMPRPKQCIYFKPYDGPLS